MEQQISLFEPIKEKNVYNLIKKVVDEYGVDRYYRKFLTDRTYTFYEIETKLCKLQNYENYLDKLYEELKKHFKEVDDDYNLGKKGIAKREKVIILYQERSVGPIYCLSMLKECLEEKAEI